MKTLVVVVIALGACRASETNVEQSLFDCADPAQRFTCAAPDDPDLRYVCHANAHGYVKIAVSHNSAHVPGVAHGNKAPDQAPGASALDAGTALDCECNPRTCEDACTGAADGTACDDGIACTGDGACVAETCQPGVPSAEGTTCADGAQCDGGGVCVALAIVINEAESSGGVPGDWVELFNAGSTTAHVGGWHVRDNDDTHDYVLPAGTTIAPGAYLVVDESALGFGLGGADSVRLFDDLGLVDAYAWTAHAVTTYGRCPDGSGAFRTTTAPTKGAANDCAPRVKLNEIESNGGVPGDWAELYNAGPIAVDLSGWAFRDNDDTHTYVLPSGTSIAAGGYLVLDEATFGFGLGGADSARLFDASGALVDAHAWTAHAASTYGRCPNGTGPFGATVSTKGAANNCGGTTPTAAPWPGSNMVTALDVLNAGNISGLVHDGSVLWAVQNGPSNLWRIDGATATATPLFYPDGSGDPDAEDVTIGGDGAFFGATERDNANNGVSRPSILRFVGAGAATHEWNLAATLPALGPNIGLEAITFVPDAYLASISFYNPAAVAHDFGGLFFVGVEQTGTIHAYALSLSGAFTQVASFPSGDLTSKALSFDASTGYLYQHCGAGCAGQTRVLALGAGGTVTTRKLFDRPTTMGNLANEGIALGACTGTTRPFYWADDGNTDGKALRVDTIPCGAYITP